MNFPLSREDLQRLPSQREEKELNEHIAKLVKQISDTIVNFAYQGKTSYMHDHWAGRKLTEANFECIVNALRENFPDSQITALPLSNGNQRITVTWS